VGQDTRERQRANDVEDDWEWQFYRRGHAEDPFRVNRDRAADRYAAFNALNAARQNDKMMNCLLRL